MRKYQMFKKILLGTLIFFLIALLLIVILYWRTNLIAELVKNIINTNLRPVATINYSSLQGNIFQTVSINDLSILLKNGTIITSNSLKIHYSLFSALSRKYIFQSIILDSLYIRINDTGTSAPADTSQPAKTYEDFVTEYATASGMDSLFLLLPTVEIGKLKVGHGKLEMVRQQPLSIDSIRLELSAKLDPDVFEFRIFQFSGIWSQRNFDWRNLSCEFSAHHDRITLNKLQLITPYSQAFGSMDITVSDTLAVILGLEDMHIDYRDINSMLAGQKLDSG